MERFIKTNGYTNFRSQPTTLGDNIITTLTPSTVVQVLEDVIGTTWSKAKLANGTIGYITNNLKYVTPYTPKWAVVAQAILDYVDYKNYLGVPYVFGSSRYTDVSFDCSDFQQWIFKNGAGISIDWDSRKQSDDGIPADLNNLRTGDLIFFARADGYIHHVAMYVNVNGKDRLLHTFGEDNDILDENLNVIKKDCGGVTYSEFSVGSYWRNKASLARRIIIGDTFE